MIYIYIYMFSGIDFLGNSSVRRAVAAPPVITFTSGTPESGTLNGFTYRKLANTGNYSFTMTNFKDKTINFIVLGGGSGGQRGFASQFKGGSGGSGGQCVYGSYVIKSNSVSCSARVGLGGNGSYYGNGNQTGIGQTVPVGGGDNSGTVYGTTTANDPETSVAAGQVKCSGGYSQLQAGNEWGTIKALGGLAGDQNTYQILNTCPSTGFLIGSGATTTFVQGKNGGRGNTGLTPGENGVTGELVSFAGTQIIVGSSAGGSSLDQNTQSTSGTNAGRASGSLGSYTGHSNPNATDGFPGSANSGAGGGGASGSGGAPYNSINANYARQKGGNGGSGVIYIWWN